MPGKKKSKFKVFKSFFGKKKKKEPEDAWGGRKLKPSLSTSNINISALKPVHEDQTEPRAKSNMGSKALSHDSIFMMDPEPANKIYPSPELQRGRSLQRPYVSRTLPRTGTSSLHRNFGVTFGPMLPYVPRSALWAGGSDIAESPSLLPRQRSISPPLIRSDTISKDLEEISVDEESPESSPKDVSEQILTMKKIFGVSQEREVLWAVPLRCSKGDGGKPREGYFETSTEELDWEPQARMVWQ
ncbi:acrosomal protein KIAA1210 [Lynx canadensis]|uniref:acrosomal protein KIAA1210 n=1 Tax=Lynx canadensis TaxID=61383 RepID=UPI0013C48CF0|nr:acrosomal protein KIAA1210 [Lynx canadensis]